ncbi:hypothetical protein CF319_g8150 [Tilletia indica]|nr:hypothetical protein CF319_g8150 [Tilletia indica]
MTIKRTKTVQAVPAAKRAPPRCRKGCKDPDHPSLGALKASCKCNQPRSKDYVEPPSSLTSRSADVSISDPTETTVAERDTVAEALRAAEEALAFEAARTLTDQASTLSSLPPAPARTLPTFALSSTASGGSDSPPDDALPPDDDAQRPEGSDAPSGTILQAGSAETAAAAAVEMVSRGNEDLRNESDAPSLPVSSERKKQKVMSDAEGASIWLDLNNAHEYLKKNIKYETSVEERSRYIRRGLWRVTRSVAELGARTGTAVFFAFAHLDPGKHKTQNYVYADPVLCDPSRESLKDMAMSMFETFLKETDAYRESQRASIVEQLKDRHEWQQKELDYQERIRQLEAQVLSRDSSIVVQASASQEQSSSGSGSASSMNMDISI